MRFYSFDFNKKSDAEADKFDLAAAHSGVSNGRNARYLDKLDTNHGKSGNGKSKNSDILDIILTQNVDYEVLFESTMDKVRDAEDVVDKVLDMAAAKLAESQAKLDEMIDRLPTLEDGTKVARSDKDGQVYTLDGKLVDPDVAVTVQFKGHEDSLEGIEKQKDTTNTAFETLNQARHDEARMGEIREEMTSDDKPSTKRLHDIGEEIEAIADRNNSLLKNENSVETTAEFGRSITAEIPALN